MNGRGNFRRGSVELLVLHLLNQRDYYGYELTQTIKVQTEGVMDIPVGSLYPALYKLIDKGYISDYKKQVGKRLTRIYYHIEPTGKEHLKMLLEDYYTTSRAIQSILNYKDKREDNNE